MKRAIALLYAVILLVCCSQTAFAGEKNLLSNGSFEIITSSGAPEGWFETAYRSQAGYSRIGVTDQLAYSGKYCAVVENASANDARYTCTVKVKPESLYRLSGFVYVDNMEDTGNGANFGIEGIYSFSDCLFDTQGQWQYLEWYGETGEDQTEVTIGVRVGGYSAESTGKAYFDDLVLEEVEAVPDDVIASLWYQFDSPNQAHEAEKSLQKGDKSTGWFILVAVIFAAFVWFVISAEPKPNNRMSWAAFAALMMVGLVVRLVLAGTVEGYEVDINCFKAWSLRMASVGPAGFYAPDYFCDYPPAAMLLLWPVGMLLNAVGYHSAGALLVVKILPIICDLLSAYCLYCFCKKRISDFSAVLLSALYLFNPAVLVNGAGWGQMDSVLTLLLVITTIQAMRCNWRGAVVLFTVSALVKPQALLFAPVGLAAFAYELYTLPKAERRYSLLQLIQGLGLSVVAALLIAVPFAIGQEKPVTWLFHLYGETLGSYAYATLNTANLYYLAGANWTALTQEVPALLAAIPALIFAAAGAFLLFCPKKLDRTILDNINKAKWIAFLLCFMAAALFSMLLWNANYSVYGYAMMVFAYLYAVICLMGTKRIRSLAFYMALALAGVYVIGIKVHERYLFPALLLLLISYTETRDRRILGVFAGFSVTTFINTAIVLDNSILFGASQGHLNQDTMILNLLLCVANLFLYCYMGWLGLNGLRPSAQEHRTDSANQQREANDSYRQMLLQPKDHRLHLTIRDYLLMGVTAGIYAALAFSNLGSSIAPQTAWVSTSPEESVVLKLDEPSEFSVMYYAGVSYNDFAISVSSDGVNWSEPYPCEMREGLCYRWNYALETTYNDGKVSYPSANPSNVRWMKGSFLRVEARDAGLNLWELVAKDRNGNTIPLTIIDHSNAQPLLLNEAKPAEHLIDEQHACTGDPSWYNGTYFDEIYHARTAYEHLHGQAPYETTHPPLGKLMMSAAIALFGMTPFGWRFAGALIGVLMLPAIYLLALQLTHKRLPAVVSMLALTFDLMHFTQTRIATIDSFPVFFILLTYLFMIRYMQMDSFAVTNSANLKLFDKAYVKTLVPLLMCGICMGLSIASKWIGVYSAVGLAILFFVTIYRHYRVSCVSWEEEVDAKGRVEAAQRFTLGRIAITCGFCVVFFVLIPCMIYCLCYIPYLSPTGPVNLTRIIRAQEGMLSYHSTPGLGMDHPFQSPWWQWPFILKPMWFAQDTFEPAGYASTILCFGNPWVFYIGAVAMAVVLMSCIGKYVQIKGHHLQWQNGDGDLTFVILAVAFLAQYLPWVLVPRSMYMYHYFASVPFIIIATSILLDRWTNEKPIARKVMTSVYIFGAIVFFIMFFPYASGYLTSTKWLDAMKWFSKLYY